MATFYLGMATLFLGLATLFLGITFFQNGYILVPHRQLHNGLKILEQVFIPADQ